ncbi:hypothetical protein AMES_6652 [Amycolatopsis mediterranei S699]|uniref:Uncharacterized protein n=2 Tax=Amycolatopsis mediterranei TaxID=33910 RepID=A0A0H3DE22_AMYMU|nr:hypothetical protein [Amycolatopsis mediterranei]ADJ48477.1 hypothetical protein AMED_6752 [Amycolatopsis mediterranei U32]AEK45400.1 hypothetical protein RAM_34635 [Amycolatopsis mediterranei S699]AFO80188.1 hypothetical protein AMES_6652 [Amycolatopsis mediterranei S699]AGT87316.1 hypothetical protein B737_6652 [Amycolatopsis mediterranei RB]KDO10994.1 hypothetical protein DV26_10730 [Amycolatopsis mediterranei]
MSTTLSFVVAADRTAGHAFRRLIAETLRDNDSRPGLGRLEAAAGQVRAARRELAAWLRELIADQAAVAEIAKRSYWHPNGFAKIVLHTSVDPEFRIRLHVWPRSETPSRGESNPHSHRWEFASYVLTGTGMHMVDFAETTEGGRPYQRYRYGSDPANPAALAADGEVRLRRRGVPHVQSGDVYTCDTSIVHTVRPIDAGLTATVVVQGPRRTPTTVVYCEPGESDDQPNFGLTDADFVELVTELLSTLDSEVAL